MCFLESCCCCFSLTVGMHFMCLSYMGYFSYYALSGEVPLVNKDIAKWYVFGGLVSSICGWIGLRWEKKFFLWILFLYDVCLAVGRSALIYTHYYNDRNIRNFDVIKNDEEAQNQTLLLVIQLYCLWVQLSYLQKEETPVDTRAFHPVPQATIITEYRRGTVPAPASSVLQAQYPGQLAYPTQVVIPVSTNYMESSYPIYPPNYMQQPTSPMYMNNAYPSADNSTQAGAQPFPYDAPPPYSESKLSPSAPSLETHG